MAAAIGFNDLLVHDGSVFHIVQLELLRMTEVLKDFPVLISDCNTHDKPSFLYWGALALHRLRMQQVY